MWNARQAGLTDDDLRAMTYDEVEDWLELRSWYYADDDAQAPSDTERAFFHLG